MELVNFIGQENVMTFFLLFMRVSALMVFFPFYSHMQIPISVKMSFTLFLTIFLFPLAQVPSYTPYYLVLNIISEALLGLCASLVLAIVFAMFSMAGEQISMIMGFSMANVIDPQSGINTPIIANALNFIVLLAFLMGDGHHAIMQFVVNSLEFIELGGFYPGSNLPVYFAKSMVNLFLFGFIISFPILALSLLSDLIFGMLMKTMPQFNLLVVGFPIKITIAFVVLIAILSAIVKLFTTLILEGLNNLPLLFFSL